MPILLQAHHNQLSLPYFSDPGYIPAFLPLPGSKPDDAKISGRRCHKIVRSLRLNRAVVEAQLCGR
uniref:hypothetical protein n=1 Tax=Phocaeicola coprophilus TaxID=387090 RepID=UPI0030795716